MLLASNIGCSLIHLVTGVSVSTYRSLFAFILDSEQKTPGAARYTLTRAENGSKMKAGGSTDNLGVGISWLYSVSIDLIMGMDSLCYMYAHRICDIIYTINV